MKFIRTEGIPLWVTILTILVGLLGTVTGLLAMFDPAFATGYIEGVDALALSWAGRSAGLGVTALLAVYLRSANGYAVALGGSLIREIGDNLSAISTSGISIAIIGIPIVLVCFVISFRAAQKTSLQ